jgi:hypothetical protein
MNERIKELAAQSGFRSNPDVYDRNQSFDIEKFAELIVNECAGLFPLTFTDERYQRRIDKTIKKHFGVEK